jgi:hypothetical protein
MLVGKILEMMDSGLGIRDSGLIDIRTKMINIPFKKISEKEIDLYADKYLADRKWNSEFGDVFGLAVEKWRRDMKVKMGVESSLLEISVLEIGILKLIFINAELFSGFEKILQERVKTPFIVFSCSNGLEGYLPNVEEYEKGGYEVETAIFFYNSFLPVPGSLEKIAWETIEIIYHRD